MGRVVRHRVPPGDRRCRDVRAASLGAARPLADRLGKVRAKSAADLLINSLPGAPIVTVNGAADLIGRTYQATNQAIDRLVEAKIVRQVNVGGRNRALRSARTHQNVH